MEPELASYAAVCDGVAQLFQPFVEVVLHDLETETAAHIAGNFSKREIGEPSLLHEIDFRPSERLLGPYEKVNWDGRRIKSISIILRNSSERPIAVMCINADVSHFHAVMQTLSAFASIPVDHAKPASLFKEDWLRTDQRIYPELDGIARADHRRIEPRAEAATGQGPLRRRRLRGQKLRCLYFPNPRHGPGDRL